MLQDFRQRELYREVAALFHTLREPGKRLISDAANLHVSPNCRHAVFDGTVVDVLEGELPNRICQVDLSSGETRILTSGPNDRTPKYSPDGRHIAFLSDRHDAGDFQLYLLDPVSGAIKPTPQVKGWIEYLHWSPDGQRILLGVAGYGADVAGRQGAIVSQRVTENASAWMPLVEAGDEDYRWRGAWVYDIASDQMNHVDSVDSNIWEVVWCGPEALVAVVSSGPEEGRWYKSRLHMFDLHTGNRRVLYTPQYQLGWPAASPLGTHVAVVEALCSDRWSVAGELRLIDTTSGKIRRVDTNGIDITHTEWRSDKRLLLAGHRGSETVVALYDTTSSLASELWTSREISTGEYIRVSGLNDAGDCVLIGESFALAPEIGVIRQGNYQSVKSFDLSYTDQVKVIEAVEHVTWQAPDGLQIQGWLLLPKRKGPHPLVMNVHGGPVSHWRPTWLGRTRTVPILMLLKCGYAIFLPNPRGSSGRGQDFAQRVLGDIGGADAHDLLSGLDYLVQQGIADPRRLGVTGISYGGFMTAWLVTQDSRFAAAVAVAPLTNHVTAHLTSNIPDFMSLFLADYYTNVGGKYFKRSPVMHAHKVNTPTLSICGALDRCTPPTEAVQFHNALLQKGKKSVLVTYPGEGHGVRKLPAAIDYAARVVAWFQDNMPATALHD